MGIRRPIGIKGHLVNFFMNKADHGVRFLQSPLLSDKRPRQPVHPVTPRIVGRPMIIPGQKKR